MTSWYVRVPAIETLPLTAKLPVTSNSDPLNVRFALSWSAPFVPAVTTLPEVRSLIFADAAVKFVPSKVKFALSTNLPLADAKVTRVSVRLLTFKSAAVVSPEILTLSNSVCPSTSKSLLIPTFPLELIVNLVSDPSAILNVPPVTLLTEKFLTLFWSLRVAELFVLVL